MSTRRRIRALGLALAFPLSAMLLYWAAFPSGMPQWGFQFLVPFALLFLFGAAFFGSSFGMRADGTALRPESQDPARRSAAPQVLIVLGAVLITPLAGLLATTWLGGRMESMMREAFIWPVMLAFPALIGLILLILGIAFARRR